MFEQLPKRNVRYDPSEFAVVIVRPRLRTSKYGVDKARRGQIMMGADVVEDQRRRSIDPRSVGHQNLVGAGPWNCHAAPFDF